MSNTLDPFIRHELDNKPNDVHGRADKGGREDTGLASRSGTLAPDTQRDMAAKQQGNMRPALYYTQQEQTPCPEGVWESERTVQHKLLSKEDFPLG